MRVKFPNIIYPDDTKIITLLLQLNFYYSEEIEETNGKLKNSQFRINELEKELAQTRNNSTDTQKNAQQVQQVYNELEMKYYDLRYYIDINIFILKLFNFNRCMASNYYPK